MRCVQFPFYTDSELRSDEQEACLTPSHLTACLFSSYILERWRHKQQTWEDEDQRGTSSAVAWASSMLSWLTLLSSLGLARKTTSLSLLPLSWQTVSPTPCSVNQSLLIYPVIWPFSQNNTQINNLPVIEVQALEGRALSIEHYIIKGEMGQDHLYLPLTTEASTWQPWQCTEGTEASLRRLEADMKPWGSRESGTDDKKRFQTTV